MATRNLLVRAGFDASGMRRGVTQGTACLNTFGRAVNGTMGNVGANVDHHMHKIGALLATAFAVNGFIQFGKSCIDLGSNLSEVQNVVDVTFGDMARNLDAFAQTAVTSLGISETSAKKYASTMGSMLKSMGLTTQQAYGMSTQLTTLSADMASFYNIGADDAFAKIRAGISGETEPLKQLGINMSVANLEAYALSKGINTSYNAMTQQQKALLRYNYLLSATTDAQNDFKRTSGSWANQTRVLDEQFNALKATLGQAFIQMLTPVVKILNTLVSRLQQVANYFNAFTSAIFGKQKAATGITKVKDDVEVTTEAVDDLGDATEEAGKKATKATASFDEVNTLAKEISGNNINAPKVDTINMPKVDGISMPELSIGDKATKDAEAFKKALADINTELGPLKRELGEMGQAFGDGLDSNLEGFEIPTDSLNVFKKTLKDIFSDTELQESAHNLGISLSRALGSTVGSMVVVGGNLIGGVFKGITDGIENKKETIKERLTDIFTNQSKIAISWGNIVEIIGDISEVFTSENAIAIWSDITEILIDTCTTGVDIASKLVADLVAGLELFLTENKTRISDAFDNTFGVLSNVTETLKRSTEDTCETIVKTYDEQVSPALGRASVAFSGFGQAVLDTYNNYIAPNMEDISAEIDKTFKVHLQPTINDSIELFGQLCESVGNVLERFEPFIDFVVKTAIPTFSGPLFRAIKIVIDYINLFIKKIKDMVKGLEGVIIFLEGFFTGHWDKAWEGIKIGFGAVWEYMKDKALGPLGIIKQTVEDLAESIKDVINELLYAMGLKDRKNAQTDLSSYKKTYTDKGLESLKKMDASHRQSYIDRQKNLGILPEGADEWIMDLPHYASGGLINKEQIAVLGEGNKQEAVIPLQDQSFMDSLGISIANAIAASNVNNAKTGPTNIILEADMRALAKAIVPYLPEASRRMGVVLA